MAVNNYTKICPLIRRISDTGGTFYTFSSAAEDLTLSFNETSNRKFRFSKFALLNIPDILNRQYENTLKLNAIPGAYNSVNFSRTTDNNIHFAESFQNYCLNLETMVLSADNYDADLPKTVSERVFFKWLKELGGIRFQEQSIDGIEGDRYIEESEGDNYNRVVKYIGDIDFVNKTSGQVNSYTEVYVHVPTEVGHTPDVLFKSENDDNYDIGLTFCRFNEGLDNEIIAGRSYDDVHPDNLDIHSFWDNDSGIYASDGESTFNPSYDSITGLELYKKKLGRTVTQDDILTDYDKNVWWYTRTSDCNCFHLEPGEFGNAGNYDLAIYSDDGSGSSANIDDAALKFRRSRLDGVGIDFDPTTYSTSVEDVTVESLIDLARSEDATNFEFNAILVYYDLYEDITDESLAQQVTEKNVLATNLFGVLFLNKVEPSSLGGGYIPRFHKCRPNSIYDLNGNAYGFKLNIKLDVSANTSGVNVETMISDSNTLSMDIYAEALKEVFRVSQDLVDSNLALMQFEQRLRDLEDLSGLTTTKNVTNIANRLTLVENTLSDEGIMSVLKEKEDILGLINKNYQTLFNILNNNTSLKVMYDLGSIKSGPGIKLDVGEDRVKISASNQDYNYPSRIVVSSEQWQNQTSVNPRTQFLIYETELVPLRNYLRFDDEGKRDIFTPQHSLKLFIKDSLVKWSKGQILRLYWATPYDLKGSTNEKDLYIYTDFENDLRKTKNYSALISKIPYNTFQSSNNKPILEIHCIEPSTFQFLVDIIN